MQLTIWYVMFQYKYRHEWEFRKKSYDVLYANSDVGLCTDALLMLLFGPEHSVFISFQKDWNTRGLNY